MKTRSVLIVVTLLFLCFTLGVFIGKNSGHDAVTVSVPPAMQTLPPETTLSTIAAETEAPVSFPVNINTASQEELMALPGIGEEFARRILSYRQAHGPFASPEELMNVTGIGEKRLESILELITIGG